MGQEKEAVYLINGDKYLHLRENGAGVGFATYKRFTGEPLESGQISKQNLPPDGREISYNHTGQRKLFRPKIRQERNVRKQRDTKSSL